MDVRVYNRGAWDRKARDRDRWTVPVVGEEIACARQGDWRIVLTPTKPVPRTWFGELAGARVLCLASGGGQQGPILAAAGADVCVFDNSPVQLERDRETAEREGLRIRTEEGDMADLSRFDDGSFDLIVHPVSNIFVPDVRPVWREAFRVLRSGGAMLSGMTNPMFYIFDLDLLERGIFEVRHELPYSDLTHLDAEKLERWMAGGEPLEFSHTLTELIAGQTDAGFLIADFYEDIWGRPEIDRFCSFFFATRAIKPDGV